MSRFFSEKYSQLTPYTPGEQPQDRSYNKLNTNESPFPPSPLAQRLAGEALGSLNLYSDPVCGKLVKTAADLLKVAPNQILFTNGSDEALNFAFMAFCDDHTPAVFPDISYGFYPVFAQLNRLPYTLVPLLEDFSMDVETLKQTPGTLFIANPNAPTGMALPLSQIEVLLQYNPNRVVVVDEAYVDFGAESALSLINQYSNLLVVQTFSKSRSMAGARLGFAAGCADLIQDLNTIKYSTNPYNVNSMTMAAGIGALADWDYFEQNRRTVIANREWTVAQLKRLGFTLPESSANFIFATHPEMGGLELYQALKANGILVRHFETPRLKAYNRISIGSRAQMENLVAVLEHLLTNAGTAAQQEAPFTVKAEGRSACVTRTTAETDIDLALQLDGSGKSSIDTGVGFLNHMLTLFASHGRFDLKVFCKGDIDVDYHHTVEDIGIALGTAFAAALGDKRGIHRYGDCILPMDEALVLTAVDFSGRDCLDFDLTLPAQKVGEFDTELVEEFWLGFVRKAGCALHLRSLAGKNTHHIIEGAYKSAGRSLRQAVAMDASYAGEIPSTKGVL